MKLLCNLYHNKWASVTSILVILISVLKISLILPDRANKNDFAHYYLGTKVYFEGKNPYKTDLAPLYDVNGFVNEDILAEIFSPYPPSFFFIFWPFTTVKFEYGFFLWVFIETLCLFTTLYLTYLLLRPEWTKRAWLFYCMSVLASVWVFSNFYFSQLGIVIGAIVLTGYRLCRTGRCLWACILIAVAGLLKIFPFLFLPWFLVAGKATFKNILLRTIIVSLFVAAVIVLTGLDNWVSFYHHSRENVGKDSLNRMSNYSLPALISNLSFAIQPLSRSESQIDRLISLSFTVGLILIGIIYFFCLKTDNDPDLAFSLLSLAMLAGNMRSFGHYFVFLIFPMAVAFLRAFKLSARGFLLVTIIYLMLNFAWFGNSLYFTEMQLNLILKILVNYIPLYGLIALIVFLLYESWRSANSTFRTNTR